MQETAPEANSVQRFLPLGERSPLASVSNRVWSFRRYSGILQGSWVLRKNCTETLLLLERDAAPSLSLPGQRTLGTRSAHPGLASYLPDPALALASRRPQRGHRAPPVPREMFQAFPGEYDSGSRCSSSPSAESQYLSSVDSFGSPPTAAASQVSDKCFGSLIFLSLEWVERVTTTPQVKPQNPGYGKE